MPEATALGAEMFRWEVATAVVGHVLGIDPFWQRAAVGTLILAAIGLDRALALRVGRRLRGRSSHG